MLRRRLLTLPVLSLVLLGVVGVRLVDVQVRHPDRYLAEGEDQRIASVTLPAGRGALVDRDGQALALSVPRRTVYADPSIIDDPGAVAAQLAPLLHVDRLELQDRMTGEGRFSVLARVLDDDVADTVEALDIRGIGTFLEYKRERPSDDLARSVVGTVSGDGSAGISGLELQLDDLLTGTPGEVTYERSKAPGGGAIAGTRRRIQEAQPGAQVSLTLDQALQYETERILAEHLERAGAEGGTAIISRPSTGEVLALANLSRDEETGAFDPSANNLGLTTVYEPGSVNKVITVAGALEEGLVTPDTVWSVPDELEVGDHVFTDSHPHPTTDWSITDIVATSSNVGTIMLGQGLGGDRLDEYLRRFGFGSGTGVDFPAESHGLLLDAEDYRDQSTALGSVPIGQGVSVTALQMLQAFNVLANDGTYVPARLVREVTRADGTVEPVPSEEPHRVVSATTAASVRAMMEQVVSRGTGQAAAVPGYSVAGKTGTARKPQPDGGYEDEDGRMHYVATFVGLLPAENPDLSILVAVDEPDPSRSIYAGDVAAPAFSELARWAVRDLDIPPAAGGSVSEVPDLSDSARDVTDAVIPPSGAREEDATGTAGDGASDPGATGDDADDAVDAVDADGDGAADAAGDGG
ncbi:penicillin-binding protein 2 [Iamia majanohamensis]|uniref:Penicillin-binding protein 2 n=1 Tax=Iamia majanohamensis TaxID=467976 RepID=A0AAF0BQS1_9ACTN|nr:penicillin-binding protein 2 [Iamia majanohamensis]WCO65226.1 penicillin-binding protein 2 [Iamia majanohamensis]